MISPADASSLIPDLNTRLSGEIQAGETIRRLYATDASVYREMPLAVAFPENPADLVELVRFAAVHRCSLIPRTAGTSLAGQVVGHGIVVDLSRHWNRILEINPEERLVRVQPGVVRDELNLALKPYGLLFGPETSTSNRAMIGGMVGNNSCGSNSLIHGNTRDHLLEAKAILADGSTAVFGPLSPEEFREKTRGSGLEARIYNCIEHLFRDPELTREIKERYPGPAIKRRNNGYALDQLLLTQPFNPEGPPFNFCRLIAGSEGTLCFLTEVTLSLDPMPPPHSALICGHFQSVNESLKANRLALPHRPRASELIDRIILECTRKNIEQRKNRFFIEGDPGAILVVELAADSEEALEKEIHAVIAEWKSAGLGYHYPVLRGADMPKIWNLRKAGLGLLSNVPGDAKPVAVVEDTAVDPMVLPEYIEEYDQILEEMQLDSVYYAHAGSGEIHIRPVLDLKTETGRKQFREVAQRVAALVRKYGGSLSGEHGDGRLRGEFIPFMLGETINSAFKSVKGTWDPDGIFNPGKIVDTPAMDTHLRYDPAHQPREPETFFDFSETKGILRAAEMCNGSGDCRKAHLVGGTMCPSYHATRNEKDTTRARANILREILTHSKKSNPFDSPEIHEVMDLCLSCKGCKSECPSNVDVARLKSEFLQHYHDANGIPFRTRFFGEFEKNQKLASIFAPLVNFLVRTPGISRLPKAVLGIHPNRSIPAIAGESLAKWVSRNPHSLIPENPNGQKAVLFIDEFTNYLDVELGKTAIRLLAALGYELSCPPVVESGRAALSKGMVRHARERLDQNVRTLAPLIKDDTPLLGIEPSAILTFRDEAPDLVSPENRENARAIAAQTRMIDEFLAGEIQADRIGPERFIDENRRILLHGHCHQKALASTDPTRLLLELPKGFTVTVLPTGCCGMAGSFGYEKEHFEISQKIGNLALFPALTSASEHDWIAAPGTSCRHQIKDGTGRRAFHPVEILWQALK